jgi:hypothetical protein
LLSAQERRKFITMIRRCVLVAITFLLSLAFVHCDRFNRSLEKTQPSGVLDARLRCAHEGRTWLARLEKEQQPYGVSISRGQFAYDQKMDTCLCYYYLSRRGTVTTNVTDILAEKDVLTFTSRGAGSTDGPPMIIGSDKRPGAAPVRDMDDFDSRVRAFGFEP